MVVNPTALEGCQVSRCHLPAEGTGWARDWELKAEFSEMESGAGWTAHLDRKSPAVAPPLGKFYMEIQSVSHCCTAD